jgi:hypothetical protein
MKKINTKKVINYIGIALFLGGGWAIIGRKEYLYNHDFGTIYGVSLFPLTLFPIGLIAAYVLYYFIFERLLKIKKFWQEFLCFSTMYIVFLLIAETVAYYFFDIHNLGTEQYPGLPICNCLHAPHWMQAVYLLIGPIYFLIVKLLNRK